MSDVNRRELFRGLASLVAGPAIAATFVGAATHSAVKFISQDGEVGRLTKAFPGEDQAKIEEVAAEIAGSKAKMGAGLTAGAALATGVFAKLAND